MLTINVDTNIGNGANGVVFKGSLDETNVVVKTLFCFLNPNLYNLDDTKKSILNNEFEQESNIVKSLSHKNLVKCYGLYEVNNIPYIVMELCDNIIVSFKKKTLLQYKNYNLHNKKLE